MEFISAFVIGGTICLIGQLLIDKCKLLPIHITVLFVFIGSILEAFNIYDSLIAVSGAGVLVPISNFGHSMTHAAVESALEDGFLGLLTGLFNLSSSGLSFAVFSAFIFALIFKPRG